MSLIHRRWLPRLARLVLIMGLSMIVTVCLAKSISAQVLQPLPQTALANSPGPAEAAAVLPGQRSSEHSAASNSISGGGPDFVKLVKRMATSTMLVVAACVIFLIGCKKFGRWKNDSPADGQSPHAFRVLQTIRLGHKNCLQLIEADHSRFVVGVDPSGIKSIVPVTAFADHLDAAAPETPPRTTDQTGDAELLALLRQHGLDVRLPQNAFSNGSSSPGARPETSSSKTTLANGRSHPGTSFPRTSFPGHR